MARYWIADLHLGHEKVAKLRGFANTAEHDAHCRLVTEHDLNQWLALIK